VFRIEIFVDDRKLSYVLWAISGHCLEVKPPQPVVNAEAKNGKVRAKTSGDRLEMLKKYLQENKINEMRGPNIVRDFCVSTGLSEKSYSNVLSNALKAKLLKRRPVRKGSGTYIYSVIKGGA
jgi:hypothetical protein